MTFSPFWCLYPEKPMPSPLFWPRCWSRRHGEYGGRGASLQRDGPHWPRTRARATHHQPIGHWIGRERGPLLAFSPGPPPVGSRAGAPAVGGGFPVPLFRLRNGFTMPPWLRFQPPPRQTQRAVFPHCAFLLASYQGLWGLSDWERFQPGSVHPVVVEQAQALIQPREHGDPGGNQQNQIE